MSKRRLYRLSFRFARCVHHRTPDSNTEATEIDNGAMLLMPHSLIIRLPQSQVPPLDPEFWFCDMLLPGSAAGVAPGCGAYFDAHLACSCLAWKTPSRPKLPSAKACESSLKVSGGASVPVYETGSVRSFSFSMKSTRVPERLIEPGTTFPATRRRLAYASFPMPFNSLMVT